MGMDKAQQSSASLERESYEMTNASSFADVDLEQQRHLIEHQETQNQQEEGSSDDATSQTSRLFDDIGRVAQTQSDEPDFNSNPTFAQRYYEAIYKRNSARCRLIALVVGIILVLLWAYTIMSGFSYPGSNKGSGENGNANTKGVNATKPTTPSLDHPSQGTPSSILTTIKPSKSIIPIVEHDIHEPRKPIPFNKVKTNIRAQTLEFIPTHGMLHKEDDHGLYLSQETSQFIAKKLADNTFQMKLHEGTFKYNGKQYLINDYQPSYNLSYGLITADASPDFRHSKSFNCWFFDSRKNDYVPIVDDKKKSKIQHVSWSPNYNYATFIQDNNLYVFDVAKRKISKITDDGSQHIFNGKPDWVYEEEVLNVDRSFWWSPNEENLVFMKLNDTKVRELNLEFFINGDTYPQIRKIKYPKPGDDNPKISLHNYNFKTGNLTTIDRSDSKLGDGWVLYGMVWVNDESLIIKETDRTSAILNHRLYNPNTKKSKVTFSLDVVKEYNGWVDNWGTILSVPKNAKFEREYDGYIDVLNNAGYNHLAFFPSPDATKPTFLTSGDWEVTTGPISYDAEENKIYFGGNRASSFEQHIYSVGIEDKSLESTVEDLDKLGYYKGDASPSSRFILLTKTGPDMPRIIDIDTMSKKDQKETRSKRSGLPNSGLGLLGIEKTYHKVEIGKDENGDPITVNLIEKKPRSFNESVTYPLLVNIYGGPGSQKTDVQFQWSFEDTVSDKLSAVIVYVDPRGTGGQGWKYRSWAKHGIGKWEGHDISVAVKKWIASRSYINTEKTAIWGWSYGGFSTLKTLEFDKGDVFKYGMAVAPVTDWRLYDSIYTERYMGSPKEFKEGYDGARINDVAAFKKVKRFLVMHGTGDDNVHIQNTFSLLDKFDLGHVENYDMRIFPDSNHNINFHDAYSIIMDKLLAWITNAYDGKFDTLQ